MTFRRGDPAARAARRSWPGSIFTFSLTLGDYITPTLVSSTQFIGNVVYSNVGIANNLPLAAAFATVPVAIMIVYLLDRPAAGRVRVALMHLSNGTRRMLRIGTGITLAFIYIPLIVIAIYAFNESRSQGWPIEGFTTEWFSKAFDNPGVRDAALDLGQGAASARPRSRSCWARWPRSPSRATASSAARRSRSS